jgi:DNA-binding MarR family transcriptional regulator
MADDRILRGAIVNELWVAFSYAREIAFERLRAVGVDPADYRFLSFVRGLQPVTRTTLAQAIGLRRTTLRDAVRPLIERGLMVESPHPTDRRATQLSLSPAGEEILQRGGPVFEEFLRSLDDEVDGKLDELEQAVWTVRVALERLAERQPS